MKNLQLLLPLPVELEQAIGIARKIAPSLMSLLRRGSPLPVEHSQAGICCQAFGIDKQRDWPIAPITASVDGLEPGNAFWLRIDPAHLEVGMGGLMLRPASLLALSPEETLGLVTSINRHWREAGLEILAPNPARWYLRLPGIPDLFTTPLDQVVGEYLTPHLPRGGDANRLVKLVNEAQMLMHDHPVNQARERDGRPAVNGLWLWGGGVLASFASAIDLVASDEAEVRALATAAAIQSGPTPSHLRGLGDPGRIQNALVTLSPTPEDSGLEDYLAKLERNWFGPTLRNLTLGRIRRIHLDLLAHPGQAISVATAQAWRFWR